MNPLDLLGLADGPDRPAILTRDGICSTGEILGRARAVARRLEGAGVAGRPVVVNLDAGVHFAAGMVGAWMAGSTPVLLDPLVKRELERAVDRTGAGAILRGQGAGPIPDPRGVLAIAPSDDVDPGRREVPGVPGDRPVLFLYTSGSTGEPALVPKTFAQVDVERRFITILLDNPRRAGTLAPWCHIFGLLFSFVVPLRNRGVCDLSAGISPLALLERAAAGLLDLVVAVPAIYRVMNRMLEARDLGPFPGTCSFVSSGAALPSAVRARFEELTGRPIVDFYGSTEAGGVAYRADDGPWRVEPHVRWRIAPGGYLEVGSESVSVATDGGFYRLGDLVRAEGEGFVLVGRADDVVKIGGRRLSLDEIREVVEGCPGVEKAAVLARAVRGEPRIVVCVVPSGAGIDPDAVKAFVRSRLADHKVPRVVHVLDSIPMTPAGKIDRPALDEVIGEGEKR